MADQPNLFEQVVTIIEQMRPAVQMHGGDIELVAIQDLVVYVRLTGACVGCPVSAYTLKVGIEQAIKEKVPDIQRVMHADDR